MDLDIFYFIMLNKMIGAIPPQERGEDSMIKKMLLTSNLIFDLTLGLLPSGLILRTDLGFSGSTKQNRSFNFILGTT